MSISHIRTWLWYAHSKGYEVVHIFPEGMSPKVTVMAREGLKLVYYDAVVVMFVDFDTLVVYCYNIYV